MARETILIFHSLIVMHVIPTYKVYISQLIRYARACSLLSTLTTNSRIFKESYPFGRFFGKYTLSIWSMLCPILGYQFPLSAFSSIFNLLSKFPSCACKVIGLFHIPYIVISTCIVLIMQYQKSKNPKQLLNCLKIAETSFVQSFSMASSVTSGFILLSFLSVVLHVSGIRNALLGSWLNNTIWPS